MNIPFGTLRVGGNNVLTNVIVTNKLPLATNVPAIGYSPIASDTSGTNWYWGLAATDLTGLEQEVADLRSVNAAMAFQMQTDRSTSLMNLRSSYMSWMGLNDDWDVGMSSNSYQPYNGVRYVGAATLGLAKLFNDTSYSRYSFSIPLVLTNGYSIMCWVKPKAGLCMPLQRAGANVGPAILYNGSFSVGGGGGPGGSVTDPISRPTNVWYHVGYSVTGTYAKLYINGGNVQSGNLSDANQLTNPVIAFNIAASGIANVVGKLDIDDLRFYNREIDSVEWLDIWNGGAGTPVITSVGLGAAFTFENNNTEYVSGVGTGFTNIVGGDVFTNSIIAYTGTNYGRMVSSNFTYEITPNKVYAAGYITSKNSNTVLNVTAWGELSCDDGVSWYRPVWTNRSLGDTREMWEAVWTNTTQTGTQIRVKWIGTNGASYVMEGSQRSAY